MFPVYGYAIGRTCTPFVLQRLMDYVLDASLRSRQSKIHRLQVGLHGCEPGLPWTTNPPGHGTWPKYENATEVRAFLGTCGYYRRFIRDFAQIAAPLYDLLKNDRTFEWTATCQAAFETFEEPSNVRTDIGTAN